LVGSQPSACPKKPYPHPSERRLAIILDTSPPPGEQPMKTWRTERDKTASKVAFSLPLWANYSPRTIMVRVIDAFVDARGGDSGNEVGEGSFSIQYCLLKK